MLVVTRNDKSLRTPVRALLESSDRPDGMFVNVHDQPGSQMVGPQTIKVDGRDHVRERGILRPDTGEPVSFLLSPNAFFQTNVGAARELVRLVAEGVAGATRVLDLYSGSGLFTIPLALAGVSVTAVEDNRQATADLSSNLRLNRMPEGRVRVIAATVEDALPRLRHTRWEAVILDPPRQGCSAAVIRSVFQEVKPPVAVMVSCNPEALASDLERIRLHGYRPVRIQAVDMFPHTDHIETVVVLHKT
jgi:23S rRNA (uracil1939-C5)-methyltransferase